MPFNETFRTIWRGGYFEGEPTDPMASSSYGIFGFHSSLYLIYRVCIKPYITADTTVLEIGPGRGAWTKAIADLGSRQVYAVDVVDPEYAGFWNYVGTRPSITHIIAHDFTLKDVPDNSVDYFFSFGCFCHLKPEMSRAYIQALSSKMRPGAHGFLMIADFDKFNACVQDIERRSICRAFEDEKLALVRNAWKASRAFFRGKLVHSPLDKSESPKAPAGAWFHFGVPAAVQALESAGFTVLEADTEVCHRDPVVHFVKRTN